MTNDPTPTPPSRWVSSRLARVGIRVARTYLQSLLGFIGLSAIGTVVPGSPVPPIDSALNGLLWAVYAALFPSMIALVQNLLEELQHIDPGTVTRG
jgi:hypothetical protein